MIRDCQQSAGVISALWPNKHLVNNNLTSNRDYFPCLWYQTHPLPTNDIQLLGRGWNMRDKVLSSVHWGYVSIQTSIQKIILKLLETRQNSTKTSPFFCTIFLSKFSLLETSQHPTYVFIHNLAMTRLGLSESKLAKLIYKLSYSKVKLWRILLGGH